MAACIPCASVAIANPIVAPVAIAGYAAYKLSKGKKSSKRRKLTKKRRRKTKKLSSKTYKKSFKRCLKKCSKKKISKKKKFNCKRSCEKKNESKLNKQMIFYTGIGSKKNKYYTEKEFLDIMNKNFKIKDKTGEFKNFKLTDWIKWSGAEIK